jgi:hypothetical protein
MIETKVIDLKRVYNFVVDNFFHLTSLPRKILFEFRTFEIQIFQTTLDGELNKTKGVGLDDIYNFPTETFLFEFV